MNTNSRIKPSWVSQPISSRKPAARGAAKIARRTRSVQGHRSGSAIVSPFQVIAPNLAFHLHFDRSALQGFKSHHQALGSPKEPFQFLVSLLGQPPTKGWPPGDRADHRLDGVQGHDEPL